MSAINLTLNKPTNQSSFVLPYSGQRAVDGSIAPISRWLCNSLPGFITVDLGSIFSINRWVVDHLESAGFPSSYNNQDFKLQKSIDNINWVDVDSVSGNTSSKTDRIVTEFLARFVRVLVTNGIQANPQLTSILEFEVYAPTPAPPPSRGITTWNIFKIE